jgi:RHS repeat-associated protein
VMSFLFLLTYVPLNAQSSNNQIKDVVMPSPATTAFAKYVDIPVSYHTGVPNISLPIGSVTDGTLELPISLSYHASGIRMAETASWVGLGWNINAVGQVTRTVNGYPDEKEHGYLKDNLQGVVRPTMYNSGGYSEVQAQGGIPSLQSAMDNFNRTDYEPDLFSFSAGGYSGKFYIHPTQGIVLIPKQDLTIQYDDPSDGEFDYFTIITPVGDRYHFGKVSTIGISSVGQYENALIPSNQTGGTPGNPSTYADTRQTWYLVKIEDQNKVHSIDITYEKELFFNTSRSPNSEYRVSVTRMGSPSLPFQYDVVMSLTQNTLRLSKITNSTGTIEVSFNANTIREDITVGSVASSAAKRLDEIVVKLGSTTDYTKKFVFGYDYLQDVSCTAPHCKRLRLIQLQEISGDNTLSIPAHTFEYEGDNTYPNRYSKAIDHWGFYNGATSNNSITTLNIPSRGGIREPNETYTKKGILKKINYPTGGNVEFLFESNSYQKRFFKLPLSTPQLCGGLRIKKISASDGTQIKETSYDYSGDNGEVSSGLLVIEPTYELFQEAINGSLTARLDLKTESAIVPLADYNGYHIYYDKVAEIKAGIGRTVYKYEAELYSSYNFYSSASNTTYPFRGSPIFTSVNKLKSSTNIANNNAIVSSTTNDNRLTSMGYIANTLTYKVSTYSGTTTTAFGSPELYYAHFVTPVYIPKDVDYGRLKSKIEMLDNVEIKTEYTYSNLHNNPIEIKLTNSTGKIHKTKIYYPLDHPDGGGSNDVFNTRFITAIPYYTENYVDNTFIGGSSVSYGFSAYNHFLPSSAYSYTRDQYPKLERVIESYNDKDLPLIQRTSDYMLALYYEWDAQKRLKSQVLGRPWAANRLTTSIEYIGNTSLANKIIDANGLIKKYSYDKLLRLDTIKDRMKADGTDIQATMAYTYHYKNSPTDNNYIGTNSIFKGVASSLSIKQYSDGLGRPMEVVKELYTPPTSSHSAYWHQKNYVSYDVLGRQNRSYLPFETGTLGFENSNILLNAAGYIETAYEASPLSRPISQKNVDGTFTYMSYGANTAADAVQIITPLTVSGVLASASSANIYAANLLYKTTMTDENGKLTCVFKDKLGRVILTRKFLNGATGANVDTYNVYDATVVNDLTFQYKYDNKNRLSAKKIPGASVQKFYYDSRDLLVLTQDGNMYAESVIKHLATLYDDIGRVVKTGFANVSPVEGVDFNLTDAQITDKLTETQYYPNKSWVKHQGAKVLNSTNLTMPTNFLWSYTERRAGLEYTGNPVWQGKQHLRYQYVSPNPILDADVYGVDWVVSGYNGMQQPDLTIRYLFEDPNQAGEVRTWQNFTYDNGRRLTDIKYSYGTGGAGISNPVNSPSLSNMNYNFKDQLIEKNIGYNGTGALQSIDYAYNIRGWLTNINNVALNNGTQTTSIMTPTMTGSSAIQNLAIMPFINRALADAVKPYRGANANELPPIGDNNSDLFSQNITYGDPATQTGGTPQYNGNISSTTWQVLGRDKQAYGFKYDGLDRLTEANYFDITELYYAPYTSQYSTDNKFKEAVQYDIRGNIVGLQRYGLNTGSWTSNGYTAATYGMIDNLVYNYKPNPTTTDLTTVTANTLSNTLLNVKDMSLTDKGFKYISSNPAPAYTYDANGNLTSDLNKNIVEIKYNYLNLPILIRLNSQSGYAPTIEFVYDATGVKLKKIVKVTTSTGTIVNEVYDYINGVEYRNNVLQRVAHTEGSVVRQLDATYIHEYTLRDHLGNTRVTFTDANNDGVVLSSDIKQINHYYPFGLNMEGNWQGGAQGNNKYAYNGKEWNDDFGLGWNDYGARFYDPAMARWVAVDPLAEKYSSWSPYNYVMNNPSKYVDPNGRDIIYVVRGEQGKTTYINSTDKDAISGNASLQASIAAMKQTKLGSDIWEKYAKSTTDDVYLTVQEGLVEGNGLAATLPNLSQAQADEKGLDISRSKGKRSHYVRIGTSALKDKGKNKGAYIGAEAVYHEFKAHIDNDPTNQNSEDKDHKYYGSEFGLLNLGNSIKITLAEATATEDINKKYIEDHTATTAESDALIKTLTTEGGAAFLKQLTELMKKK